MDANGVSRGYGFVHFEEQGAADKAISTVNGKEIEGKIVFVGTFQKRTDRPMVRRPACGAAAAAHRQLASSGAAWRGAALWRI
jgi:RNA recognition motif-containing protein